MINVTIDFFDRLMRRYTPDPFVLALILTAIIFLTSLSLTPATPDDLIMSWGGGFWKLVPFTMQMVMVLVAGYVVAMTPLIHNLLLGIAKLAKTPGQAVILISITGLIGCWLNWGLGLVMAALLCREMKRAVPAANFRLLVASAYTGFLVWHGGLSGSIPLVIATPGNFTEQYIGGLISAKETLFCPLNIAAVLGLMVLLPITNWLMGRGSKVVGIDEIVMDPRPLKDKQHPEVPAEWLEKTRVISVPTAVIGLIYITMRAFKGSLSLDLNTIIFIFIFIALLLHKDMKSFLDAINEGARRAGPILIQFPFYAGIMGIMVDSGLGDVISAAFVKISTKETYGLLTFYSAGFLNLFIPSGGGQWAVQAPIVLKAAKALDADIIKATLAVAWGDAWTNMLQPFWALPVLAISGLKIRDIMGYCIGALIVSGIYLSIVFTIF